MSPLYQPGGGGTVPPLNPMRPTGALYETFTRQGASTQNSGFLTTTRLSMFAIELPSDLLITSITFVSATTAASVPLNQVFGLYDEGATPALLRGTVDDTTTAWGASTAKTLALTSTYLTTRAGFFYLGLLVVATTVPTLVGISSLAAINGLAPVTNGISSNGVTALPNPAAAVTATVGAAYAWVS